MSIKMCALLAQRCFQALRWTIDLCTMTNLKYSFCMIVSRDDAPSSIAFFNSALVDVVACSSPYLAACNSLGMRSFSAIKNITLELVASAYAFVASAITAGCLCTLDTITRSRKRVGDAWTSGVGTLRDYTTLCCDSSKDMLCTSASGLSSRISLSP